MKLSRLYFPQLLPFSILFFREASRGLSIPLKLPYTVSRLHERARSNIFQLTNRMHFFACALLCFIRPAGISIARGKFHEKIQQVISPRERIVAFLFYLRRAWCTRARARGQFRPSSCCSSSRTNFSFISCNTIILYSSRTCHREYRFSFRGLGARYR